MSIKQRLTILEASAPPQARIDVIFIAGIDVESKQPTSGHAYLMVPPKTGEAVTMEGGETWGDFEVRVQKMAKERESVHADQ